MLNCTQRALVAILCVSAGGCWEEVKYEGLSAGHEAVDAMSTSATAAPAAENTTPAISRSSVNEPRESLNTDQSQQFADELAESLEVETPLSDHSPNAAPSIESRVAEVVPATPIELPHDREPEATLAEISPDPETSAGTPPHVESMPVDSTPVEGPEPADSAPTDASAEFPWETPSDLAEETHPAPQDQRSVRAGPEPPPVSEESPSVAVAPSENASGVTRLAAWRLGSYLSKAALANDLGVATQSIDDWFAVAEAASKTLNTTITQLPDRTNDREGYVSREVLNYLLAEGKQTGHTLAREQSAEHVALFEVAVKSNLLLVLYKPDSTITSAITASLSAAAPRTGLPAELWQPLLDAIDEKAAPANVQSIVRRLHADVEAHLESSAQSP